MIARLDGRGFLRGIMAGLCVVALAPTLVAPGCAALTPAEGAALTALDVGACSALVAVSVAIPVPGAPALVAGACAGEEAAVGAAIAHAEVVVGPTTGAPTVDAGAVTLAVHPDGGTVAVGALLYRGTGKERHIAGACPEGWDEVKRKVAQAHLDAAPTSDAGAQDGGR